MSKPSDQDLLEKIRSLPPEKHAAVEDFVDFLRERDSHHKLVRAVTKISEDTFHKVWSNSDDADYDRL